MQLSVEDRDKTKAQLISELTKHRENIEQILQQRTHELGERIKELNCLYGISKLVENSAGSLNKILQGTVNLIPVSWQYPESTCARIVVNAKEFKTQNFRETIWRQQANIKEHGELAGTVEVHYLDEKPESDEGPFLQDERNLINAIAERLGHILERIHAKNELREYREKMFRAEQLASLGTIGSTLAHQLNQPLTVIRMSIQKALRNLRKIKCPDVVKEILDDSLKQLLHASSIVKGFLTLGHVSSEEKSGNIDIYKIAVKTAAVFGQTAKLAKIKLIVEDSVRELPTIRGIAGEIEQMFFILTQNAIQAVDTNRWQWFKISGSLKEEQIELKFFDNCGGIEPGNSGRIFEPFFTTKSADQGTGLGLAILQQIVTNHNGTVRVDSKFARGTAFYVTFPVKR